MLNRKTIGTLGQMAITHLNNSYTHKVKRTLKQKKAAFENIIRSAGSGRIATTTLIVFESLRFEETGHFVSFTADKIAPLTFNLVVSTSYHSSSNLRNAHLLCGGKEFKTIKAN